MELVIQGLRIKTSCRYLKFTETSELRLFEDGVTSCFHIEFPRGFLSNDIVDRRVEILSPSELHSTDYIKIYNPKINLNGLTFIKVSDGPYIFRQFIVDNIDQFIMNYDEHQCEILIPKSLSWNKPKYACLVSKNPYFRNVDCNKLGDICNFNSIYLDKKDVTLVSTNKFEFNTKSKYTKYLLEQINVLDSFISKLGGILKDYGLELMSLPVDVNTKNVHRVTYRFTDLGRQITHKTDSNPLRFAIEQTAHIEFKLSTPDLVIYNDFKTKYQNLDLVTNFTEFYTPDKLGRDWKSSVNWTTIDTSFNQDYNQDEQGNVAFEASFSADLDYYAVYDETYYNIQESILSILGESITGNTIKL